MSTDDAPVDMGYLSLPADVQSEVERAASMRPVADPRVAVALALYSCEPLDDPGAPECSPPMSWVQLPLTIQQQYLEQADAALAAVIQMGYLAPAAAAGLQAENEVQLQQALALASTPPMMLAPAVKHLDPSESLREVAAHVADVERSRQHWEDEARRYAQNAEHWRKRFAEEEAAKARVIGERNSALTRARHVQERLEDRAANDHKGKPCDFADLLMRERGLTVTAERKRDELQQVLDLQWKASRRATERWQAANPGNDLVWPDAADLMVWLMDRLVEAEAARDEAIAHDRQPYPTADAYEAACRALEKHRARADTAEARVAELERLGNRGVSSQPAAAAADIERAVARDIWGDNAKWRSMSVHHIDMRQRALATARRVIATVRSSGWVDPVSGEPREEWAVTYRAGDIQAVWSEHAEREDAERSLRQGQQEHAETGRWPNLLLERRIITVFQDGSYLVGAWKAIEDGQ